MNETYVQMQFSLSTAESARDYFCGDTRPSRVVSIDAGLPPGTYRVIDGELFRISPGLPPGVVPGVMPTG
ncbi:MAG TPA: hypothetical protein VIV60_15240 [Polyangiaceae bacterium]